MAFKKGQDPIDPNLEEIGMEIVEKCQGVPLAIKTIGRALYFKKTEAEWLHIKNNELTNVTQLNDGILPVLKLSYDYLPSHLKCCFAYCSLFPKDYVIHKLTLIQLWIAQGFIQSPLEENRQLEDVANEYFMDLHWRSFFQEALEDRGVIRSVKMHDLIHDLAQSVSRNECTLVDSNAKNVNGQVRHLSFPFYNASFFGENLSLLVKANKIRTFILTYQSYWRSDQDVAVEESTLKTLIFTFRYLRALDLHWLNIKTVPNIIGKLMHLKYLDLSCNEIEVLPSSITRLVNLQTLNLSGCSKLRELPTDIRKLVSLRQLDTSGCYSLTHMPCGLGKLTSLQTLTLFAVSKEDPTASSKHCGGLAELNKLDLRGELEITNLAWVKDATSETKAANLKEKKHLTDLALSWNPRDDDDLDAREDEISLNGLQPHQSSKSLRVKGYGGVRFSNWLSSLTNLASLSVIQCKKCQHFPPLYQLPYLRDLYIEDMLGLEYMSDRDITDEISASLASSSTTFFPSLESLWLRKCPNLKGWWKRDIVDNSDVGTASTCQQHISLPSFPRLSELRIQNCCKLTCMPLFPYLEKELYLENASLKLLQQTMVMTMNTAETSSLPSSSSLPLSKLKYLHLRNVESLPMPEEWVQDLTFLERLLISECPTLTSLSRFMQHLTSLKRLSISNCEEVDLFSDVDDGGSESQRPTSTCLQSLTFGNISKLEALPAYLQHVTTLQYLEISKCPSFTTLPEWLGNLTSLHELVIIECPNLTSLPEGIRHLSSLQTLRIIRCPHLEQRCQKEIGEDWPKIAHVPKYTNSLWD